jgi:arylsulfatase A-like enzyme
MLSRLALFICRYKWCAFAIGLSGGSLGCSETEPLGPPNIVLISVDGLRLDRTGFGGNERETTPNLDAFARDSVWFPNAFSQANESLFSHAAIFTGRYPTELARPDYLKYYLQEDHVLLPEALQAAGYETAGFFGGGHVKKVFGFDQGLDHYYESGDFGSFFSTMPQAAAWIQNGREESEEKPFFVFLHGYDCHRPYRHGTVFQHAFDAEYDGAMCSIIDDRNETENIVNGVWIPGVRGSPLVHENGVRILDPEGPWKLVDRVVAGEGVRLSSVDLEHLKAHYDTGVLTADTYLGFFFEHLHRIGLWENTLIIVVSDHGEDLQDHGMTNHRAFLYDSTTRVPMLIGGGALSKSWRGKTHDALVDAVDLTPTITAFADIGAPQPQRGRSLRDLLNGEEDEREKIVFQSGVRGQLSMRTKTHRLVYQGTDLAGPNYLSLLQSAAVTPQTFALYHSAVDPGETTNILDQDYERAEAMRSDLVQWYAGLATSSAERTLDAAERKMLRDAGYW